MCSGQAETLARIAIALKLEASFRVNPRRRRLFENSLAAMQVLRENQNAVETISALGQDVPEERPLPQKDHSFQRNGAIRSMELHSFPSSLRFHGT